MTWLPFGGRTRKEFDEMVEHIQKGPPYPWDGLETRINQIEETANRLFPDGEYRDMARDELIKDPTRSDDEIATDLAMRWYAP